MNTISPITPNYAQVKRHNVQFSGNLGDKFVNQILNGSTVKPAEVISEMKGAFGIKTDKAEDVLESFIGKVKQLFSDKNSLTVQLNESQRKINAFPKEKEDAVWDAESKLRKSYQSLIREKDQEVAAKDREVRDMKAQLEKYQQVVKVKSVDEIATIMPDKAIEIIDEMIKNKVAASKSMAEFLLTGKGQEEALAQIERNNMIMKAYKDGITQIPEVDVKLDEMKKSFIYFTYDSLFTTNLIGQALAGSPKGNYIKSRVIKNQIKENAMAILRPMADEGYCNTGVKAIEQELDKRLADVEKYHDGLVKGIEKMKSRIGKDFKKVEFKPSDFSVEDSKVLVTEDNGVTWEQNYRWVSNYGNSTW